LSTMTTPSATNGGSTATADNPTILAENLSATPAATPTSCLETWSTLT
jgi:hypothetical protein